MAEPTPLQLANCFTQLTGHKVTFVQSRFALDGKTPQAYGVYSLENSKSVVVAKLDVALLASFAGALVGLPDSAVKEHMSATPLDEVLRDSMSEVLNVAAAVISVEARAIFQSFFTDPAYLDSAASKLLKDPFHRSYFTVQIEGYPGGRFAILAPFVPSKVAR
jgi:hypothetical protein